MMQDIAKSHCVERIIRHGKLAAIVTLIVDGRFSPASQISPDHARAEHRAQVMRNEPAAATDVKHFSAAWYYSGDLQRHVVSATDLSPSSFARPAAFKSADERFNLGAPSWRSFRL